MPKEAYYLIRARCEDGTYFLGYAGDLTPLRAYAKRFSLDEADAFVRNHPPTGEACSGLYYSAVPEVQA